ncbi:MAG: transcription antitermination factor NusB [Legionellales bacterium]|nr:transcription antitermination factor NusB [Legionellales bacterium]
MKKKPNRRLTRKLLLQAVYQWILTQLEYEELLKQFIDRFQGIDVTYFKQVLQEIILSHKDLMSEQEKYSNISLPLQEIIVQAILFISIYELKYRKEIPYRVVLNEALELSKEYGSEESYKFVNGLLDKIAHELRVNEFE